VKLVVVALLVACKSDAPPTTVAAIPLARDASLDVAAPCALARASLGPGIVVERWHVTRAAPVAGEPCIDVVRFDPSRFALRVLTAEQGARTAIKWAADFKLVAVTNAGMFHDGGAPVGLVVAAGTSRGTDNDKFGGYFAFDAITPNLPTARVFGKTCPDLAQRDSYRSLVQSYRLLDCDGAAIAWQDPKHYSAAAIGTDRSGHIVLLHARGAFTMRELSAELAAHDLAGAIFLEGGPEASLVVRGPDGALDRVGSYETGFVENDDNTAYWDLPNVIGIVAR
jgi:Phosphodiester glycosidase